jgi:hypothetical protein
MSLVNFQGIGGFEVENVIRYAEHRSRSHDAVICVYDEAGNVIETHEHADDFKEPLLVASSSGSKPDGLFSPGQSREGCGIADLRHYQAMGRTDNLFFEFAMIFFGDRAPLVLR